LLAGLQAEAQYKQFALLSLDLSPLREHATTLLNLATLCSSPSTLQPQDINNSFERRFVIQPSSIHANMNENEIAILLVIIFVFLPFMGLFAWWMAR
jgi:hypothetical protein